MTAALRLRTIAPAMLALVATLLVPAVARAQGGAQGGRRQGPSPVVRRAMELDRQGATTQARVIFQAQIDSASDPAARAAAQRDMAMSYAFDGDCPHTVRYESMVIDYWKTRERAEPQNAFYQEGEIADEAARVCLDAGDIAAAEHWYREGHDLGLKEPEPRTHPRSLWNYRLAHALGRIAARRGQKAQARHWVAEARSILDADTAMARQQRRFFPYLVGYVALYTNDLPAAERALKAAIAARGNQRDPFMHCLLAMTYERMGRKAEADALYRQAYDMARAHNPPSAYVRRVVRQKLGISGS